MSPLDQGDPFAVRDVVLAAVEDVRSTVLKHEDVRGLSVLVECSESEKVVFGYEHVPWFWHVFSVLCGKQLTVKLADRRAELSERYFLFMFHLPVQITAKQTTM